MDIKEHHNLYAKPFKLWCFTTIINVTILIYPFIEINLCYNLKIYFWGRSDGI